MAYDWSQSPQPVMSSGDGMSTIAGTASQFIGMAIDDARQSYWNEKQQQQYRENMQQQFDLGQQAQRNAARNQVAGLEAAGLSPVMGHSAAGAPVGSSQMPTLPSLQRFSPLEIVQMRNLEAQTAKTQAETESIEQKTGEAKTAGKTASQNLYNYFQTLAENTTDKNLQDFYIRMSEDARDSGEFASGAQVSLAQFNEFYAASFESRKRAIEARFDSLVAEGREYKAAKKGDWFDEIVNLPYREVRKIGEEISNIGADTENLKVLKKLNEAKERLTQEEMQRVEAMKKRLEDYNIAQYIKNGDSLGALAAFFGLLIESAATAPAHFTVH